MKAADPRSDGIPVDESRKFPPPPVRRRSTILLTLLAATGAMLALLWLWPPSRSTEDPVHGARAAFIGDSASADSPVANVGARSSSRQVGEDAETDDGPRGTLRIAVRDRRNGQRIPGASVWVELMDPVGVGPDGTIDLTLAPGSYLVGADAPAGSNFLARPYDVETDEPASERTIEVVADAVATLDLTLHRGSGFFGRVVDHEGAPQADFKFLRFSADGNRWIAPQTMVTDENGNFHVHGLEPGWFLVGTRPNETIVAPLNRFEVTIDRPALGAVATLDGVMTRSEGPDESFQLHYTTWSGTRRKTSLRLWGGRVRFTAQVDLATIDPDSIEIWNRDVKFASLQLEPGVQEVTLTPPSD